MAMMPKTDREKNMLAVILLSVLLVGAYWYFLWSPKSAELATVAARVDSLETQNAKIKAELARGSVDELRAEARRYQQNLQLMRQLVPTGNEVPALLEQVSTAARRVGLDLGNIQPQPVVAGDQFDTYRYNISIDGDYHDLGEFMTNVGSLTRIVAPIDLQLTPSTNTIAAKGKVKRDEALLKANLVIQTYVAKTGGGAPAARGGE